LSISIVLTSFYCRVGFSEILGVMEDCLFRDLLLLYLVNVGDNGAGEEGDPLISIS